jgi:hypothetical protein
MKWGCKMITYDNCKECGLPLKEVKINRKSSKACGMCLGEYASVNKGVRQIFKEMQARTTIISEDEKWFLMMTQEQKKKINMAEFQKILQLFLLGECLHCLK